MDYTGDLLVGSFSVSTAEAEPATEAELAGYHDEACASIRAEEEMLSAMTAHDWVSRLAATPDDPDAVYDKSLGSRGWLVNLLDSEDGWDTLRRLRAIMLAFPDDDITIDVTWLGEYGWRESEPGALASNAQIAVRDTTAVRARGAQAPGHPAAGARPEDVPGALPDLFAGSAWSRPGAGRPVPGRGPLSKKQRRRVSCPDGPAVS
jgi:hypothetical protein